MIDRPVGGSLGAAIGRQLFQLIDSLRRLGVNVLHPEGDPLNQSQEGLSQMGQIRIIALCGYPIVKMEIRDVKSFEK